MKKHLATSLFLGLAMFLMVGGTVEARTYKISHVRPQGTAIDKDLHWFASEAEAATNGKFKAKIYPASALGDYTVVQERVGLGAVDMACQPPATAADKRFQVIYFPYLVSNWEQARKNYSSGSPLRKTISELYAKQGIRVLAAWPVYFGGIALNKAPVSPGDPDVAKGIKLRVPPMKTFQLLADNDGYLGAPLPFSEAFTAVQTGVVDGVVGSGAEGYYASFRDVTKYYLPLNTHFEVWYLIINDDLFKGLDAKEQQQLEQVALQFEQRRWDRAEADQAANEKLLADYGAKIVPISPAEIAKTAKKIRATVWPQVLKDVGQEWGQKVLDEVIQ